MRRSRRARWPSRALPVLLLAASLPARPAPPPVTPEEARSIAREAYVYAYPMVESYKILFAYAIYPGHPEFKAPLNQIAGWPRADTPAGVTVPAPNLDVATASAWLDLRPEPIVLGVPAVERGRYWSVQMVDLYTHNFAYVGSRTAGNAGGKFLIAGPGWKGKAPKGIRRVIRAETGYAFLIFRTQLFDPDDRPNVEKIQAGYTVVPLGAFLGHALPPSAPTVNFLPYDPEKAKTPAFFDYLDFLLLFCPAPSSETDLRARFARIGIETGLPFNPDAFPPEVKKAIKDGMEDGRKAIEVIGGTVGESANFYGTRRALKNNYLNRAAGAKLGLYGNSPEEATATSFTADAAGAPLDGASGRYVLRFGKGRLPPVNGFWSLTMYEGGTRHLVANPLNRHLLNSRMLSGMKRDADGGLTIYIQKDSPGKERESNWLPAPDGPIFMVLRTWWPKPEAEGGRFRPPAVRRAS